MTRRSWLALLAFVMFVPVGCSQSEPAVSEAPTAETPAAAAAAAAPAASQAAATPKSTTPDEAVFSFLDAVRRGNDDQAGQMLTSTARQKTAEMDMVVAPPGSDTATFKVGETRLVGQDGAHVASAWTDLDPEGGKRTDQITWILRKQPNGWRIAGMATKIFADQDPVVLNFEDPQEMLEKQRIAEEEAFRRANEQQLQATRPEDPFQTQQR
ncbi:MAG: hypothetical protein KDA42_15430 [Planctomycetales bacterium]|nr:hypothetical protein [Planctomycetales bacterium]